MQFAMTVAQEIEMDLIVRERRRRRAAVAMLLVSACSGCVLSEAKAMLDDEGGVCVARPGTANPSRLPSELSSLNATLLFETDFDDEPDFASSSSNDVCWQSDVQACEVKPWNWTNYYAAESWHPSEAQFATSEPVLSISSRFARGGSGKSMVVWDESRGGPSTWGSDAQLTKRLDSDVQDLYAHFWIRFQPGYRWHVNENSDGGQNMSKLLRVAHNDAGPGATSYSFGSGGGAAPLVFLNSMVWARGVGSNQRTDRGALLLQPRCDPQETSYMCPGASSGSGFFPDQGSFGNWLGDGEWHKIAMRVKMNSSPGASDGLMAVWLDNTLLHSESGVRFKESGSPNGLGWNSVGIGGNTHNYPEDPSQRLEQWLRNRRRGGLLAGLIVERIAGFEGSRGRYIERESIGWFSRMWWRFGYHPKNDIVETPPG